MLSIQAVETCDELQSQPLPTVVPIKKIYEIDDRVWYTVPTEYSIRFGRVTGKTRFGYKVTGAKYPMASDYLFKTKNKAILSLVRRLNELKDRDMAIRGKRQLQAV